MYVCVRMPDPLELESQTVVSCRVGAGNRTRVLWKSSKQCCLLLSHFSTPTHFLLISSIALESKSGTVELAIW
ncbi:hippyragranin [Cricetulus griseus]|nr:hippyragranin [Cricetulus griseus]